MPVPPSVEPAETFEVAGHAGPVHARLWLPEGDPSGVLVLVHGYAEYGGRYSHVAAEATARGLVAVAADHVGHGLSGGERALITDFGAVVDDLDAVVARVEARWPDVPVVMVGHSMGGLITARFGQRWPDRLAGVGFLGAVLGDWEWAREVLALPELPEADSDPYGMSRDREVCDDYAADPLVYHGLYKRPLLESEVVALDEFRAELDRLTMPVLAMHGDADPFVPHGPTLEAAEAMPAASHRIVLFEGAKHELVNETNRDEVVEELLDWTLEVLPHPAP